MRDKNLEIKVLGTRNKVGASCFAYIKHFDDGSKKILLIDFGVNPSMFGNDAWSEDDPPAEAVPDMEWVLKNVDDIEAIFFTHGHLDHIGGVKYLPDEVFEKVPMYAAPFTADCIMETLDHSQRVLVDMHEFDYNKLDEELETGVFKVTPVPVAHSIPHANAFLVNTRDPFCNVFHLTDFKFNGLNHRPRMVLKTALGLAASQNVDFLVIESLYAHVDGRTPQENLAFENLFDIILSISFNRRVIVSHFASNIAKIREMFHIGRHTRRKPALLGRSMQKMFRLAKVNEFIDRRFNPAFTQDARLILATGCQGESRAVLAKAVDYGLTNTDDKKKKWQPPLVIKEDDVVIFSSAVIPGNEQSFISLVKGLVKLGATVYVDESAYFDEFEGLDVKPIRKIQVSGHGMWDDKEDAIRALDPEIGILMIHGEPRDEWAFAEKAADKFPHLKIYGSGTETVTVK